LPLLDLNEREPSHSIKLRAELGDLAREFLHTPSGAE
jgi:hypothetical protein